MSIVSELLNNLFGTRIEPRRYNDVAQLDAHTYGNTFFDSQLAKQMSERRRRGRNPRLFDRTGGLDRR
jgi:hypothetical protein